MRKTEIFRTLLVTTALSTTVCGMESTFVAGMKGSETMDPARSFNRSLFQNAYSDTLAGMSKDSQEFKAMAKKALNGDWASLAGVGIHQVIDHLNGQFLSRYNIQQNSTGEFNPESLKPFLKAFREKVTLLLQGLLFKNGENYALNERTGEHYPIFSDTPFKQFAESCIPDYMPMRGLFISICNAGPINSFLADKLDELALSCLFQLYNAQTGGTIKETAIPFILDALKTGATTVHSLATTDYDDHKSLPSLTKKESHIDKSYSPIFEYLKPRFDHLARQALGSLFLDLSESVTELVIDKGLKATFDNSLIANGTKAMTLGLAAFSSTGGWFAGGMVGGVVGQLSAPFVGGGLGWKLAYEYGGESLAPLGFVAGTLIGLVPGLGTTAGLLVGPAIGATVTGVTTYAWTPRITTHVAKSMAQTTKRELNDQLQLLIDYHTHKLLPLTQDEHVLFNLNPNPTPEEMSINYADYARREQLLSQSFAGEFIKQFIDINGSLVQKMILPTLNGMSDGYESFVTYCLSSKDATVTEILEKAKLEDSPLGIGKDAGTDKTWREFVLRTTDVLERSEIEKSHDKKLQENLIKYPSFKVKEQYLEQLSLFMNSLSAHDLKKFSENVRDMKESVKTEQERIQDIYKKLQTAGTRVAKIYQSTTGTSLSTNEIDIIKSSANKLWETAPTVKLERLVEALEHDNFISSEFSGFNIDEIKPIIGDDYLESALNEYIEKRDSLYLEQGNNQGYFNALKGSSLTEGLEDADIVDLLRKINKLNLQNRFEKIQDLFKQAVSENVESKEKLSVLMTPAETLKQQEIKLIKSKYETLLGRQLTVLFSRAFETNFKETILEIGKGILAEKKTISEDQLYKTIQSKLFENKLFEEFGNQIEIHPRSALFIDNSFAAINGHISKVAKALKEGETASEFGFEFINISEDRGSEIQSTSLQNSVQSNTSWLGSWRYQTASSTPSISLDTKETHTNEMTKINTHIETLKLYDEYDVGASNLIEIMHNSEYFREKKLDSLQHNDFEEIYDIIQENKTRSIIAKDDLIFLKKYKNEIAIFKMTQKNLENKLFYGYTEVIREIRKQNQQILGLIQNLRK